MSLGQFIDRQFIHNNPPDPKTSFVGKTVIVTSANSGLGLEACKKLAHLGASLIILACRDVKKGNAAVKIIQEATSCSLDILQVWQLDMSSYVSVLAFADRVVHDLPRLDALLLNAGTGTMKFRVTEDNEEQITTNVISTSLLALLLHPKLRETAKNFGTQTNLTVTGSELYEVAKFKERRGASVGEIFEALRDEKKANMTDRYNVSKLLIMFVVKKLAALSPVSSSGVIVNIIAPGFCQSGLFSEYHNCATDLLVKAVARPAEVGARTLVWGACAGVESHGQYLPDCKVTQTLGLTKGEKGENLQTEIWSELREKLEFIRPGVTSLF